METPNVNTVPTLAEKLKDNKISITELSAACTSVGRNRIAAYVTNPEGEKDVVVINDILDAIEKIMKARLVAKENANRKLSALLNSEPHPITD